ncbi:MAG TPA: GreA/GreB family elongation factor [Pseudobacteroides sp.]|uniref:GreA/GreB family elongation factor n=1 Tax=Pseudobacteroides sp. TaxID=1968840 RepID=UPI002F9204C4
MCKNLLSKKMYDFLTWHTNEIAKEQEFIFRERYSEETHESMNFEAFFKEYLTNINNYLSSVSIGITSSHDCPFVIIGSIVDVHDSDDMEDYQYRIVLPYKKQQDTSIVCASCLSPLGKSLLFKSANENVNIQIPAGELHYMIKKISIPEVSATAVNCQVF